MRHKHIPGSFVLSVLAGTAPAYGASSSIPKDAIVITPYRHQQRLDRVGSSISVITREELQRRGVVHAADALKLVPSVVLSRNGGQVGSTSFLRLRGAEPAQVQVLMDGVVMNDPSSTGGEYDFNGLLVEDIERIEVLRGPQSALYGSNAMGGVIHIITRQGEGPLELEGLTEAGSYGTFREAAGLYGSTPQGWRYGFNAQHLKTDGFSRVAAGDEKDGSRLANFKGNVSRQIAENVSVNFVSGYSDLKADFDPSTFLDGPASSDKETLYGQASAAVALLDGQLQQTISAGGARTERGFDEPVGFNRFSAFDGTRKQARYQADYHLRGRDVATAGLEWQEEKAKTASNNGTITLSSLEREVSTRSIFGQYLLGLTENWTLTAGGRVDDHQRFGHQGTYRFTNAYHIDATDTTLRATYGTAFKAPSLFQLYSPFGNPQLNPEENKGWDVGVEQAFPSRRVTAGVTVFRNRFDNLIDFDVATFRYMNIVKARTQGIETAAAWEALPWLSFGGSYTYLQGENEQSDRKLPRRPKHGVMLRADADLTPEAHAGLQWRHVSRQLDSNFSTQQTKAYSVADAYASYDVRPGFTVYAKLENLFNRHYQEVLDFNTAGFSAYAGVRARY